MENQLDDIRKWFESEEGKQSIERSREQDRQTKARQERWIQRFKVWVDKNSADAALDKLMDWYYSDKYRDREYRMGFEPREDLIWLAWEYAKKYGVECDDEKYFNPFTWSAYYLGTYVIQIMNGQGSAIRIDKVKDKVIRRSKKERIIDMIESRIKSEHKKHSKSIPNGWTKIAAQKIYSELQEVSK
jgi:hypothetical protein